MAGGIVVNLDEGVVGSFVKRWGVKDYDPRRFMYYRAPIYDTLAVGMAAAASIAEGVSVFFDNPTATRTDNPRLLSGCNLSQRARLPGGEVMIVDTIEARFLARTAAGWTAADSKDAAIVAEGAVIQGIRLNQRLITPEVQLAGCLLQRGLRGSTVEDASATAATFLGVHGLDDGEQFTLESLVKITDSDVLAVPLVMTGLPTLTQPPVLQIRLNGLRIRPRQ